MIDVFVIYLPVAERELNGIKMAKAIWQQLDQRSGDAGTRGWTNERRTRRK